MSNVFFKKTDKDGRKYTTIPLHAPGETVNGATNHEWRGMKPPKGRHWRSEPKVLEQLEKEDLIEWSSNGVPRKKIYVEKKRQKETGHLGRTKTRNIRLIRRKRI